jgi:ABC-type sugar transport system ATPase subunit
VILISHNMPHVFEVADRIHIHRLGRRVAVVTPQTHTMNEVVAIMTGAAEPGAVGYDQVVKQAEREDPAHAAEVLRQTNIDG